jgi:hypothetical protein
VLRTRYPTSSYTYPRTWFSRPLTSDQFDGHITVMLCITLWLPSLRVPCDEDLFAQPHVSESDQSVHQARTFGGMTPQPSLSPRSKTDDSRQHSDWQQLSRSQSGYTSSAEYRGIHPSVSSKLPFFRFVHSSSTTLFYYRRCHATS